MCFRCRGGRAAGISGSPGGDGDWSLNTHTLRAGSGNRAGTAADASAERKFEIAADAAGLGVWEWDLRSNSFEYSRRAKEIYGFPLDRPVEHEKLHLATHPDDRDRTHALSLRSIDPAIRAKESYRYRIVRPDGEIRWVVAHGEAAFEESGGALRAVSYIGTLQDITDQKQAEEALIQSEARLRLAVEAGKMAVWELDPVTKAISHSEQLNRLYGFPPDAQPTVADLQSRYAPGERDRIERQGAEVQARGETEIETEFSAIWPDGTLKWLLLRAQLAPPREGEAPKVIGVVLDVTDSRLSTEALRQSETRLRISQEAAGIGSLELDIPTGEVIGSEQFFRLWGLEPAKRVHISVLEGMVIPEDSAIRSNPETRTAGTAVPNVEYRIRRRDSGEIRWLSRQIEFTRDASGKPAKMFGVMQDITERKEAEARQRLLTHELEHRIKNILAMVSAIASQTLRNDEIDDAREAFLARMRALAKAHDLLTEARWTDSGMKAVVEAALAPHLEGAERATLTGPDVMLTPKMALSLALAVNELATNAAKYGALSNAGGHVDINWSTSEFRDDGSELVIWTWRESGGPPVAPPSRRGFGSVLISRVLAADFGGDVRIDYPPTGVVCVLTTLKKNLRNDGRSNARE